MGWRNLTSWSLHVLICLLPSFLLIIIIRVLPRYRPGTSLCTPSLTTKGRKEKDSRRTLLLNPAWTRERQARYTIIGTYMSILGPSMCQVADPLTPAQFLHFYRGVLWINNFLLFNVTQKPIL